MPPANASTTSLQYILKTIYPNGLASVGYENSPALALIRKRTDFTGENQAVPLRYGNQTGRSADFTRAKALKRPSSGKKFLVTRAKDYCLGGIDAEAMKAAMSSGAIAEGLKNEIESMAYSMTRSISGALFKTGGGVIGQIASGVATPTLTLTVPDDIVNFEVGMTLDSSATPGDAVPPVFTQGGNQAVITAVDRIAGTVTAGVAWNNANALGAGLAVGDYLFQSGDYGGKIKGFNAWIPSAAPGALDNFFGVNRSSDVTRLGGIRVGALSTIEETLLYAVSLVGREGGKVDTIFMHPLDFKDLVTALGSKVMYTQVNASTTAAVGFKAVEIIGTTGPVKVIADLNCERGTAWALQLDTWCLWSLGDLIHTVDDDGNKMLRDSDSDSVEIRMRSFAQLVCSAPGYNARVVLPVAP
jgi:hypothetical protein